MTTTAGNILPGFRRVEELSFWGRLDDKDPGSGLFEGGLQPHAILAFELKGKRDGGNDRGIYAEFGISPSMGIGKVGEDDLTLTLPITAGFSLGNYYERTNGGSNDAFGFLQFGGQVSAPMSFLPARMGAWLGYVGLSLIVLGGNNELRNSGDTADLIFAFGMSTEF
jgi:hypothetical protein